MLPLSTGSSAETHPTDTTAPLSFTRPSWPKRSASWSCLSVDPPLSRRLDKASGDLRIPASVVAIV